MSRFRLILSFLILAGILSGGFLYWRQSQTLKGLVSFILPGNAVNSVSFQPSFPSSFTKWNSLGITVSSTGKVFEYQIKNRSTGEVMGNSLVLETVSKSADNKTKKIYFVVQLVPVSNPQRSVNPWIVGRGAELSQKDITGEGAYPASAVAEIFPRDSKWILVPFLDLEAEGVRESVPEYRFYAQSYYGNDLSNIEGYVADDLVGGFDKPILLLDIFVLF